MKKKSTNQPPPKPPKNENKQSLKCLIKNLRPKVYITDSSNFKNLVQELTGNGSNHSPPPSSIPLMSPPTHDDHARVYQENSVESSSSCFSSTPLEGSPDLRVHESHDDRFVLLEDSFGSQNQGFPSLYADLETLLMEMDSINSSHDYDGSWYDHGMINQQEVCVYDYDLSTMI